jgi:hypothetical protein
MRCQAGFWKLVVLTVLLAAGPAGAAFSEFALGAKVGTLGLGGEVTTDLLPQVNLRGSLQWLDFNYDTDIGDIHYDLDLEFLHPLAVVDWYPFGGSFRLSGGVLFDGTDICLDATAAQSFEIGGRTYEPEDLGSLRGEVEFNAVAPYVGLGFGNPLSPDRRWGLALEIGVAFIGSPDVTLSATSPNQALADQLAGDLAREEQDIEDDLEKFQFYPVLSLSLFYRF